MQTHTWHSVIIPFCSPGPLIIKEPKLPKLEELGAYESVLYAAFVFDPHKLKRVRGKASVTFDVGVH
jgi:hypothetical protein